MKKMWLVIGCILIFIAGIAWFLFPKGVVAPQAVVSEPAVTESAATTSAPTIPTAAKKAVSPSQTLPTMAKGEAVASWNFSGAYTGNPELMAKAEA
ncbi:hypothetical protein, partial [Staphylococcus aureus]